MLKEITSELHTYFISPGNVYVCAKLLGAKIRM